MRKTEWVLCPECGGDERVWSDSATPPAYDSMICPTCSGSGKIEVESDSLE